MYVPMNIQDIFYIIPSSLSTKMLLHLDLWAR